jgi:hypothetical protein
LVGPTIFGGQYLSDPIDCSGFDRVIRIIVPSGWNGAPMTFQLSPDGTDFHDLFHVDPHTFFGFEVIVPRPVPGAMITLPPGMSLALNWLKIRSGTASLPVAQDVDCAFQLVGETTAGSKMQRAVADLDARLKALEIEEVGAASGKRVGDRGRVRDGFAGELYYNAAISQFRHVHHSVLTAIAPYPRRASSSLTNLQRSTVPGAASAIVTVTTSSSSDISTSTQRRSAQFTAPPISDLFSEASARISSTTACSLSASSFVIFHKTSPSLA